MLGPKFKNIAAILIVYLFLSLIPSLGVADAIISDHNSVAQFDLIPSTVIEQVKYGYRLYYGHTSHGSQIVTGMSMLRDENLLYDYNNGDGTLTMIEQDGVDLGTGSDASSAWVDYTRNHLNAPDCQTNVVMWSWCGGVSDSDPDRIDNYLNNMSQLEADYPYVTFVYMTGHLDGTGPTGNLYVLNNQIREYCINNGKILFDFADIESYDPDGNYFPYASDACGWCTDWCAVHDCYMCPADCAHSHCFNCYLKGRAFWWMMATIDAWHSEIDICGDVNYDGIINILDIIFVINFKYRDGPAPVNLDLVDVNNDGDINIMDIVRLIDYKYKSGPAPICPQK